MEYRIQRLLTALRLLLFLGGVALVVAGQKQIGYPGLSLMLLGLVCMLLVLWDYNRRQR